MKKIGTLILAALLAASLISCDTTPIDDLQTPSDVSTNDTNNQAQTPEQPNIKTTVEESVLLDESGIKITAKSLETDAIWGTSLKILIENNTDTNLTVQCRSSSVNGYMIGTMMSADVAAGKKAHDEITFLSDDLELCGIETIADMSFTFHIFNTDDWETYLDSDQITLTTSSAEGFTYVYDDSGKTAYEGNNVKVVIKGLREDSSLFGPEIVVYIENNSEKNLTVQARDVSVNGFMVDALFSCEISNGKHAVDTITFLSADLEDNGITTIEEVELSFHIFDTDSWETAIDTESITITFE